MSLDYAILGFLSEGDHSGYDLKTRCFDDEASHFWTADQAQIYRTLDRLERGRLVSARRVRQTGRPDRKVYTLTRSGREALDEWLTSPHHTPPHRDSFLIRLRFGSEVPAEALIAILETERLSRQERLGDLRVRYAEYAHPRTADRRAEFARMTVEAALANERATIDWLDDCIETLRSEQAASETGMLPQRQLFGLPDGSDGGTP